MRRALDLARAGIGLVSPNPAVGAVIVEPGGNEVGAGTHTYHLYRRKKLVLDTQQKICRTILCYILRESDE